ncbi:MAG TPA: NAD-dependent epimerase/dehydratase family protein, partial [Cyclobacteriaceae bacterium]|nr:NAD-dependent epimerase/dehydratase family protein [Cyclobacteriaceae bacterium]
MSGSDRSYLITGVNGFIGSHVVLQKPKDVTFIWGTDKGPHCQVMSDNRYTSADITKSEELTGLFREVDVVVHAAGKAHVPNSLGKDLFDRVNVTGTANLVKAAAQAGVKHFILVSSVAVYGRTGAVSVDETCPCHPKGEYAQSKYEAELAAIRIAESTGMALTILRLATAYGNGDPGNVYRLLRTIQL